MANIKQDQPTDDSLEKNTISDKTRLPLGIAITLATTAVIAALWVQTAITDVDDSLTAMSYDIRALKEKIDSMYVDRWTSTDMMIWVEQLKSRNPNLTIPDITLHRR